MVKPNWTFLILLLTLITSFEVNALVPGAKQKISYQLLTDDYDILNSNDLMDVWRIVHEKYFEAYTWGFESSSFSFKKSSGINPFFAAPNTNKDLPDPGGDPSVMLRAARENLINYWQCFPRKQMSFYITDTGEYSNDYYTDDLFDMLEIIVEVSPYAFHKYKIGGTDWGINAISKILNQWRRITKNEEYVCLAGSFEGTENILKYGKIQKVHNWIFDKIKTKKGCFRYLHENKCS